MQGRMCTIKVTVAEFTVEYLASFAVTVTVWSPTKALFSVYTDTRPLVGSMVNSVALSVDDSSDELEIEYCRSPQYNTPFPPT
jgi:hypothetical protein